MAYPKDLEHNLFDLSASATGFLYGQNPPQKWTGTNYGQCNPIAVEEGDILYAYKLIKVPAEGQSYGALWFSLLNDSDITQLSSVDRTINGQTMLSTVNNEAYFEWTVESGVTLVSLGRILNASPDNDVVINLIKHAPDPRDRDFDKVIKGSKVYNVKDSSARARLDVLEDKADSLEKRAKFSGKVINCLGDSITAGWIGGQPQSIADPKWTATMALNLDCTVNNYGVSGSGICGSESYETFSARLARMTETKIDLLLIFGGTNDYGNDRVVTLGTISDTPAQGSNFYASFKYLIEQAMTKYPDAMIGIITPMRRQRITPNAHGITPAMIVQAELDVAEYYSIPVFDFFHHGVINPELSVYTSGYTSDGLHPNQKGIDEYLAPQFSEFARKLLQYRPNVNS